MDEVGRSSAGAGANISPTPCFPERSGGSVVRPEEERPVAVGGGADEEGAPVSASFSWGMFTPQHGGGHQPPPQAYGEPHPPGHGNAQAPQSPWAHFHQGIQQDEPAGVGRLDAGDPFCPLPLDQQQQQARTMMTMGSINAPATPIAPTPHGRGVPGSTIASAAQYVGPGGTNNINFPPQSRSQDPQPPPGGYDATPSDDLSSHNSEDTEETGSSSSQSKDPLRGPKEKKKSRAPRRPLTAYKLFFREERSRIRSEERANKDDDETGEAGFEGGDRKAKGDHRRGKGRSKSKSKSKARLADLSREIKRRWELLTPEQKTYFEHMAREETQRYEGFYGEDHQGGRVAGSGAAVGTMIPGSKGDDSKRSPQDPFASASSHDPAAWDPPRSSRPQKLPEGHQAGNVGSHPQQGPLTSSPHYYPSPIRTDNTRSRMDGSSQSAPGHPPQGAFQHQQSRQEPHGQQHERGQQYYYPHPEGGPPSHPHHPPPQMQYPSFPLVPQWIESSDGRSQPVRLPPPSCVVVHDAEGVPRRYQLMYAAVSMPPDSASEYLMSVFSAARGMMGQMMTEENPHPPPPQPSGPPSAFFPGPPPPEGGPGDPRFSRGEYPHPHPPAPPGR